MEMGRCSASSGKKKKGVKTCRKTINPCSGTFFEGEMCKLPINDVLALIICFVIKIKVTDVTKNMSSWRRHKSIAEISNHTIVDYFSYFREITEIISSHSYNLFGGPGKTVQLDETFLTKRKYNRGRITEQTTLIVFGIHCKEDKTEIFFHVSSKKRNIYGHI